MKLTFYILFILLVSSCQPKNDIKNDSVLDNLTIEEINFIKEVYKQENEWDNYDKTEKSLLGLRELEKLQIKEGEFAYQFSIRAEHDKYLQVIEIIDIDELEAVDIKSIKYTVSRDCNPVIGNKELTKECIQIIEQNTIKINKNEMISLNNLILQNGFWEFTEEESEIRKYSNLLYHGESWSLKGVFAIDYPKSDGIDTTILRTHIVNRMIPEDFKAFQEIGNRIKVIANEEIADDNK